MHIPTQKETLLTPDWGNYSNVSMSPDGKKVMFIEKQDCQPTVKPDPCIYLKQLDFKQAITAAENVLIRELGEQGSESRFIIEGEVIYGINNDQQLWTFDLQTRTFSRFLQLPQNVDYITDIHKDKLLLSYVVAAKKEIVELTVDY